LYIDWIRPFPRLPANRKSFVPHTANPRENLARAHPGGHSGKYEPRPPTTGPERPPWILLNTPPPPPPELTPRFSNNAGDPMLVMMMLARTTSAVLISAILLSGVGAASPPSVPPPKLTAREDPGKDPNFGGQVPSACFTWRRLRKENDQNMAKTKGQPAEG